MSKYYLWLIFSISCISSVANAQTAYPSKPITLVVAFAPGGGTDTAARVLAKELSGELGQPVVVDNRAGAGGAIGAASVVRAAPDGYTLLFGTGSEVTLLPAVKAQPPYDPLKDFEPVIQFSSVSFVLVAHPSVKAQSVQELIALARANPGKLTYASFGIGSTNHMIGELFSTKTGTDLLHVPYKGSAAASADLLSGEVKVAFDTVGVVMPFVQSGKLKALATVSPQRSALAPALPTMAEAGVAGLEVESWMGVLAPPKTPPAIINRLNAAITKVVQMPSVVAVMQERGASVVGGTPEQLREKMKEDFGNCKNVAKTSGIQID